MCDSDFYKYDQSIDVGNVLNYKVTGLDKDKAYYFSATAYDDKYPARNHESKFSVELMSTMDKPDSSVTNPKNFRIIWRE
jgi:hypothetical protein